MQPILRIATNAIREAGREVMARASQVPLVRASSNQEQEYFFQTRKKAFGTISRVIQTSYPDTPIVDARNPVIPRNEELVWVVEPIAGAPNFVRRLDDFCSLIGIYIDRKLEHGLVIDYFRDGQATVTRKNGAFSEIGRLRVSELRSIDHSVIAGDSVELLHRLKHLNTTHRISGCEAIDLINTCSAKVDCIVQSHTTEFQFEFIRLFVRESGGFATTLSGAEWSKPTDGLVGGNTFVQREIVKCLNQQLQDTTLAS